MVTQDSIVGMATHHGLGVWGSNPGGGEIFFTHPEQLCSPPSLLSWG